MIKEVTIIGSKETSWHDFTATQIGMTINLSGGEYHRAGQVLFADTEGGSVTIPTPDVETYYEFWLGADGLHVYYAPVGSMLRIPPEDQAGNVDRIIWFFVPAGATTLDNVEVNILKVVPKS